MYPNRRGLERLGLLVALLAPAAWAHDADVVYVMLTEQPGGALEEAVTLTAGTLGQLAPVDADGDGSLTQEDLDARAAAISAGVWDQMPLSQGEAACSRSAEQALLRDGYVELIAKFSCPAGPISQDFKILRVLTSNYRVVLGRQLEGETGRAFAQGNVQKLLIPRGPHASVRGGFGFEAGLRDPLISFDVTLVWLLTLLLARTVRAVAERWAVLAFVHALVSLSLGLTGAALPEVLGAVLVAVAGAAYALEVLAKENDRFVLPMLAIVAAGAALRQTVGMSLSFEAGQAVGLAVVALVATPFLRIIARRPGLKKKVMVGTACVALMALGFSVVQSIRTF